MKKQINLFIVFVLGVISCLAQPVTILTDCPSTVRPGGDFNLAIRVSSKPQTGNARLQIHVPAGFTANNVNSKGATFVFENNTIKFSWTQLPAGDEFTVICNIRAGGSMDGFQKLTGEFIYENGDKTEHVPFDPITMLVTNDEPTSDNTGRTPKIDRQITAEPNKKGEYRVDLTFHTNGVNEPAQFKDNLPDGYSAFVIDAHEGSFSFENQSVIFDWKKFPAEDTFKVSYLVRSTDTTTDLVINGTLVYGDAFESSSQTVGQAPSNTGFPPASSGGTKNQEPAKNTTAPEQGEKGKGQGASNLAPGDQNQTTQPDLTGTVARNETSNQPLKPGQNVRTQKSGTHEESSNQSVGEPTGTNLESNQENNELALGENTPGAEVASNANDLSGIYYRIQISATKKSSEKNASWFSKKFKIDTQVDLANEDGWKKYLVGTFKDLKEAKKFSNQTRVKISDAFIVAYQNGVRIPISDAIRNKDHNQ